MYLLIYSIYLLQSLLVFANNIYSETCPRFDEAAETILLPSDHLTSGGLTTTS